MLSVRELPPEPEINSASADAKKQYKYTLGNSVQGHDLRLFVPFRCGQDQSSRYVPYSFFWLNLLEFAVQQTRG